MLQEHRNQAFSLDSGPSPAFGNHSTDPLITNMLTSLPEELLVIISNYGSIEDIYSLRRTSHTLHANLANEFNRRYFHDYTQNYTTQDLKKLSQVLRVPGIRNAVKHLKIEAVDTPHRDDTAFRRFIRTCVLGERARTPPPKRRSSLELRRSLSPRRIYNLLPTPRVADFDPRELSEMRALGLRWPALQESVDAYCAKLFLPAMVDLAQARMPTTLSLLYRGTKLDGYGTAIDKPAALAERLGLSVSQLGLRDPARALAPIMSMAAEAGCPIVALDFGNQFCGIRTLEPLIHVPPFAFAHIRKLSIALSVTAADLDDDHDEPLRYLLPLATSLEELVITFRRGYHCFLTSSYMATLTHCLSDAPLKNISIVNGCMSASGLGALLLSHSSTLRSLQLHYVSFGPRDVPLAVFEKLSTSLVLDSLELFGLTQDELEIAMDRKTLSSCFGARGKVAVADLWWEFIACCYL
jgi:hypothetical protein